MDETLLPSDDEAAAAVPREDGTWLSRRFQRGSEKGSMFNLTTTIVGIGVVSLPYAIIHAGLLLGLFLLLCAAFAAYFTLHVFIICSDLSRTFSITSLAVHTLGTRGAVVVQAIICITLYGAIIAYIVGVGEVFSAAVQTLAGKASYPFGDRNAVMVIFTAGVALPLSLMRDLSSLRFTSVLAIACMSFLTLVVVIKFYQFCSLDYNPCFMTALRSATLVTKHPARLLTTVPLLVSSYTCHPNVLPVYAELRHRSRRRMDKVNFRAIAIATVIYAIVSVFVIFTFGDVTNQNFLHNDYHNDVAVIIGSFGLSTAIILTVPLLVNSLRVSLNEILFDGRELTQWRHVSLSIGTLATSLLFALSTHKISSVLGFLGATCCPLICFLFPAIFLAKLAPGRQFRAEKVICNVLCVVMLFVSLVSLIHQHQPVFDFNWMMTRGPLFQSSGAFIETLSAVASPTEDGVHLRAEE